MTQPPLLPAEPSPGRVVRCRVCGRPIRRLAWQALAVGEGCCREQYAARRGRIAQDALPGC